MSTTLPPGDGAAAIAGNPPPRAGAWRLFRDNPVSMAAAVVLLLVLVVGVIGR